MIFRTYAERIGERRGYRRGLRKGELEAQREGVLRLLEIRFKKAPKRIAVKVSALKNSPLLTRLFEAAYRCDSLKEFEAQLPAK